MEGVGVRMQDESLVAAAGTEMYPENFTCGDCGAELTREQPHHDCPVSVPQEVRDEREGVYLQAPGTNEVDTSTFGDNNFEQFVYSNLRSANAPFGYVPIKTATKKKVTSADRKKKRKIAKHTRKRNR